MKFIFRLNTFNVKLRILLNEMERLNRKKHCHLALRAGIVGQHLGGLSNGAISRSLNVSTKTVSKWVNRYHAEHHMDRRPQPGQVRKLDGLQRTNVLQEIRNNPFTNAAVVGRQYGVHRDTVRKVWNDAGLHHRIAARKPFLTPAQEQQRLLYAQMNQHRNWDNVIFSDEKTFQSDRHQRTHCYRPDNCRFDAEYIQPTRRSGRISAGIWGWISRAGPGEMVFVDGRFNSAKYCEVLEEILIPSVEICYGSMQNVVFMQDNNSIHTSRFTTAWFANHPQVTQLIAPSNSPDLNPIENFWAETTRDWESVFPRNLQTLKPVIVENWERFRGQNGYFENLYDSMPYRMQEVIRKNGGMTSY